MSKLRAQLAALSQAAPRRPLGAVDTNSERPRKAARPAPDERTAEKEASALAKRYEHLAELAPQLDELPTLRAQVADLTCQLRDAKGVSRQNAAQRGRATKAAEQLRPVAEAAAPLAVQNKQLQQRVDQQAKLIAALKAELGFLRAWPHVEWVGPSKDKKLMLVVPQLDSPQPGEIGLNFKSKRTKDGELIGGRQFHWRLKVLAAQLKAVARVGSERVGAVVDMVLRACLFVRLDPCATHSLPSKSSNA